MMHEAVQYGPVQTQQQLEPDVINCNLSLQVMNYINTQLHKDYNEEQINVTIHTIT